jgi:primase-polymerase (primpol)-like protein
MPTNFSAIPLELRQLKQWILWRYEDVGSKKPTKVPYTKHNTLASVNNPADWCTFDNAFATFQQGGYDGLGFVFTVTDEYAFIDLDDTEGNQVDLERQLRISKEFDSYSEVSPSGQGLHIIIKGNIPQGRKRSHIEIYSWGRYATMTGNVYAEKPIADRHDLLILSLSTHKIEFKSVGYFELPNLESEKKLIAKIISNG